MPDNESLKRTLEHYLQQKRERLDELRQLDQIIVRLKRDLGETATELQESEAANYVINESAPAGDEGTSPSLRARTSVRPDEFFGMTYSVAAKNYLEKVNHAVSMDELLEALNSGGCPVGGKEPKKTLYISLVRDVRNFVPIPGRSGYLGLRKFYPNLKAVKEKIDGKEPRAKRRKHRKKRTSAAAKGTEADSGSATE